MRRLDRTLRRGSPAPVSLASRALSAIRRNGGTLLLPGASTPIGPVNQLLWSGDFTNAAWFKTGVTVSGGTLTTTAVDESLRPTTPIAVTPGAVMTLAVSAKRGTATNAKMSVWNLSTPSNILASDSYYNEINASAFNIAVRTFTVPAGCTSIYVYPLRDSGSIGTTFIDGFALFQGTVTADQILAAGGIPRTGATPDAIGYTHGNPPLRNYLDSAGTDLLDSVTQVDQPVGLCLDSMGVATPYTIPALSAFTPGGAFGNFIGATASGDTITALGINGARYARFPVAPGAYVSFNVNITSGTSAGAIVLAFGTSDAAYISATASANTSGTNIPVSVSGVAPSNAAFVEIIVRAESSGGTTTFTSIQASSTPGNHATQPITASKPILRRTSGRWSWQFDGSTTPGDFLQTGITTGNEGWVCAGVNASSYADTKTLFWTGANAPTEVGATLRVLSGGGVQMVTGDGVSQAAADAAIAATAGVPQVIDGGWNSTTLLAAINGTEATHTNTRGGTSSQTLKIGSNADGQWFLGNHAGAVICPVLPSAADRALIRRFIGSLQGQQL